MINLTEFQLEEQPLIMFNSFSLYTEPTQNTVLTAS